MNKLWIAVALAGLSAAAVAQSEASKDKAAVQGQSASAPDSASGQTAGKRMHKPMVMSNDASSNKVVPTVQRSGKTANDDWQATSAKTDSKLANGQVRVATGDVNGDGMTDATAKNSGHATEAITPAAASSNVTQPRDAASGQMSGKRQHQPVTVTKVSDAKPAQK